MTTTIAYVSCADDREIVTLALDQTSGALRVIARTAVPGTDVPSPSSLPMALRGDRTRLYAALRSPPFPLSSYAIDPTTGALQLLGTTELPQAMAYLSADRSGRWLLAASYVGAMLTVSPIDAGGLAGAAVQTVATPLRTHAVLPDPENRFVYAPCLGGDVVLGQAFDPGTGRLDPTPRPVATTRPGAGPRHLVFARQGALVYLLNELDGTLVTYARDAVTGLLAERQTLGFLPDGLSETTSSADLHLTPDERQLVASDRTTDTLNLFRINPTDGTLELVARTPCEITPRGFAIASGGRFLLCAGLTSGHVGVYAIGDGRLVPAARLPVGGGPNWIEVLDLYPRSMRKLNGEQA